MSKVSFLASAAIGGILTSAAIYLLSPKASKTLKKDAQKKFSEMTENYPDLADFVKEKALKTSEFFKTIKNGIDEGDLAEKGAKFKENAEDLADNLAKKANSLKKDQKSQEPDIILDVNEIQGLTD